MKEFKIRASQIGKIMGESKQKGNLSATCITYLKEWYSEQMYGEREEIRSKYFDKGNLCENEAIDIIAERLNLGLAFKNITFFENEFITGTPDILTESMVIDAKCSWDGKTFLDSALSSINKDYEWQLLGYMDLTKRVEAKLCYTLLDTPEEANYGIEVIYSNIPIEKRFKAFTIDYSDEKIQSIHDKVIQCREWLSNYNEQVKECLKS
jgi:hypothetical protein